MREYFAEGVTADWITEKERRRMDCTDCHNRPAHSDGSTPERAVDAAMGDGPHRRDMPFVRREAVRALRVEHPTRDVAMPAIERSMREAMKGAADQDALARAIAVTQGIYRRSVFPTMKISWGTYPNQLGHTISNVLPVPR